MIITPLQSFGQGDVIFCISIAREWIAQGHKVLWGVLPQFVRDLNRAYPDIEFIDYRTLDIDYTRQTEYDAYPKGSKTMYRVVPLRWSVEICKVPYKDCMKSKYLMFRKNWEYWTENAMFTRDHEREQELYDKVVDKEGYTVVNRYFRSNNTGVAKIPVKGIEMPLNGYSLFDWAKVLENAKEIHTVSTSIIYLLELLDLKAERICIYKREPDEHSHKNYDYLLRRHKYELM